MVKVFTTNSDGKIEFTRDELEKLLNEVWRDGYDSHKSYWWTSPSITTPYTLKQLIEQCDKIKPDYCACGICSLEYVGFPEEIDSEIIIGYDSVRKTNEDVCCKIQ